MATGFKNQKSGGFGLDPQTADPSAPKRGDVFMADGTSRSEGLWRYDGSDWRQVGGAAGTFDILAQENFEVTTAADFTTGNSAVFLDGGATALVGTLSDETTSPIAGDSSLKYAGTTSNINDWAASPVIDLDAKHRGQDIGITLYGQVTQALGTKYEFVVYDVTNTTVLSSSLDLISYTDAGVDRHSFSVFIPATCTQIRYGFHDTTGYPTGIMILDEIEFSSNPFLEADLSAMTEWTTYTPTTQGFGTITAVETEYRRVGSNLEIRGGFTCGTVTAAEAQIGLPSGLVIQNSLSSTTQACGYLRRDVTGTTGEISAMCTDGDTFVNLSGSVSGSFTPLDPRLATNFFGSSDRLSFQFSMPIEGWTASSTHIITPAKSNLTDWQSYTPTTQGFGTLASSEFFWRRLGDSIEIQGQFVGGTVAVSELQVGLPNSYAITSNISVVQYVGSLVEDGGGTVEGSLIATAGDTYLNVGSVNSSVPLTPQNGNALFGNSRTFSLHARVPIEGWTSDATFLAAIPVQKVAFLKDVKGTGVDGGTPTVNTVHKRDLNTIEGASEIVSLSNDQFTLGAGEYTIDASAIAFDAEQTTTYIYNVTDSSYDISGMCVYNSASDGQQRPIPVSGYLAISSSKTYELRHYFDTAATSGMGFAVDDNGANPGSTNTYAVIKITKLR